jgi:hypothetical protein
MTVMTVTPDSLRSAGWDATMAGPPWGPESAGKAFLDHGGSRGQESGAGRFVLLVELFRLGRIFMPATPASAESFLVRVASSSGLTHARRGTAPTPRRLDGTVTKSYTLPTGTGAAVSPWLETLAVACTTDGLAAGF